MLLLGDIVPNLDLNTTEGKFKFHDWIGNSWAILFSHPADYTPVCTTELARVAQLMPKFETRGVKLIGLSCDSVESHMGWIKDIQCFGKLSGDFPFPLIDDHKREIAIKLGMLDPEEKDSSGHALTCRAVFIIGPDKKLKLSILYPATTGRNFDEILRVIDSLQLTSRAKVSTPVDWKPGTECMVLPNISTQDADKIFTKGYETVELPSKKHYMRFTPAP
ncbi:unnamed protein product [Gordionus sp. m RMFG-2023]|uniref:peroxiredoxin-6-like n=1 Tax=Gordionus sp. m RMFG-2023 TaxID=3053472 RepID=UPI0030DFB7CA